MAMETISRLLKIAAGSIDSVGTYWADRIYNEYGIKVVQYGSDQPADPVIVRQIYYILTRIPAKVIKVSGIHFLYIRDDMGKSCQKYPNHGYYKCNSDEIVLNSDIFYNPDLPDDFIDQHYYHLSRTEQTLAHEIGHAVDEHLGNLSDREDWMKLSGWSKTYKPGLKRLLIQEKGTPDVMGELYYDPKITEQPGYGFVRFYSKRNNYDDWADNFAYYFCLRDKLPAKKAEYFDALFKNI